MTVRNAVGGWLLLKVSKRLLLWKII